MTRSNRAKVSETTTRDSSRSVSDTVIRLYELIETRGIVELLDGNFDFDAGIRYG